MPGKFFGKKRNDSAEKKEPRDSTSSKETANLVELIEKSTLQIMTHQLFMHHRKSDLLDDPKDPAWQNQAIYFWHANEKFERKSLPPEFRAFEKHYFVVNGVPQGLQLNRAKAIPWFGMEGNGDKFFFVFNGQDIPLKELAAKNIIQYVLLPELSLENAAILNDRTNYFWLMDTEMIGFQNNNFQHKGKDISMTKAYELGGLRLIGMKKQ